MNARNAAARSEEGKASQTLGDAGIVFLRSALAGSLLWVGALKIVEYEAENIQFRVSTSLLFSRLNRVLGTRKMAGLIGIAEIAMGVLIAARPPSAEELGGLGPRPCSSLPSVLSSQCRGFGKRSTGSRRSLEGQFLAKDGVLLGAAIVTAAESLRVASET